MKKIGWICLGCLIFLAGCSVERTDMEKIRDVEYTVVEERKVPEVLKEFIDEKMKEPFEITYGDAGYLYIVKGYGAKDTGGYSIEVLDCFETTNAVCVKTNLLGPSEKEEIQEETCPYIVLKIEYSDKNVILE